ncbi:MAG: Holliday junction branch migration protein RuvA [Clostridia bacterium]|nr:Holliday junction branch migration protein RuvA [Clostridia bacterium]
MYYYLNGTLAYLDHNTCVVDCGGVGYKLTVSLNTATSLSSKINTRVKLFTHLVVREDGVEMFGFGSNEERECFNNLTGVSGVGPKVAMSILSVMRPDALALAICTEDVKAIAKAPGLGPKSAARIILELKDKISKEMFSGGVKLESAPAKSAVSGNISEAAEALAVLGYDKNTILTVLKDSDPAMKVEDLIKAALRKLTR